MNSRYIVGGGRMPHFIYIQPFVVVVEVVKLAMCKFLVPEIIEADGDSSAEGGFRYDDTIYPAWIIRRRPFKKFLRRKGKAQGE